jgi:hypothetical protein
MSRLTAAALLAVACASPVAAANPYDELLKHSTANTNALVLIDVKGATSSALAKRENWAEKAQQSGYGGLGFFPADAETVAVVAEINLTAMVREFQVGLVKVKNLPNFKELAAREGGAVDELAGKLTVISPRNVYFTSFSGDVLAAVYPADRQYLARWLKAEKAGRQALLAPYLRAAADNATDNTVTIALDLEDVVDPVALKFGLGVSPVMAKNAGVNRQALSVFLARARGLTFAAKVTNGVTASITVEFPDDPKRYKAVLKDLFLELIDAYGVSIPGLEKWEAVFTDKTMTLSGSMSPHDLRRVMSLFSFPRPEAQDAAPPPGGGEGPTAGATQRYMVAVKAILDDIKRVKDNGNYAKTATWHEKAAVQLEQLSRRNVDPLAVDAAYQAARKLRSIASSLRGVPIDVDAAAQKGYVYTQRMPYYGWGPFYGGWWGGYRGLAFVPTAVQTNVPEVQGEMARIIADDQKKRIAAWTAMDQLMSDTRRKLAEKYKANF